MTDDELPDPDPTLPTSKRQYKPKNRVPLGHMSPDRAAWVEVGKWEFQLIERHSVEGDDETEYNGLPVIVLAIKSQTRARPNYHILSSLTEQEVIELRKFFQLLFEELQPVCARLDQQAQEAKDRGDDSFGRLYRRLAQLVVRKRHGIEHPARLRDGREVVQGVDGPPAPERGHRVGSEELPEPAAADACSQDGAAAPDESAKLGEFPRGPELPGSVPAPDPG